MAGFSTVSRWLKLTWQVFMPFILHYQSTLLRHHPAYLALAYNMMENIAGWKVGSQAVSIILCVLCPAHPWHSRSSGVDGYSNILPSHLLSQRGWKKSFRSSVPFPKWHYCCVGSHPSWSWTYRHWKIFRSTAALLSSPHHWMWQLHGCPCLTFTTL